MKNVTVDLKVTQNEAATGTKKILRRKGKILEITIPPGIRDGQLIALRGALMNTDQQYGNIFIRVRLEDLKWTTHYDALDRLLKSAANIWSVRLRHAKWFRLLVNLLLLACLIGPIILWNLQLDIFPFALTTFVTLDIVLLICLVILLSRGDYLAKKPGILSTAVIFVGLLVILGFANVVPFGSYKDNITVWVQDKYQEITVSFQPSKPSTIAAATTSIDDLNRSIVFIVTDKGVGSGVVYDRGGYIITNKHVIDSSSNIYVFLCNGKDVVVSISSAYPATIVRTHAMADLAIIRISGESNLTPISFSSNSNLKARDQVWAIGYPVAGWISGESKSIGPPSTTPGEISRTFNADGIEVVQVSCALNPGNSGGALVNTNNELIGIIFARGEKTGDERIIQGMGYAVSVKDVKQFIDR
jgi:S1-C subfamily serine protease